MQSIAYHDDGFHEMELLDHYNPVVVGIFLAPCNQAHGPTGSKQNSN